MAQEGHSATAIGYILDHSDSASAQIYVELRLEMRDRLDEKMAQKLAPLSQNFLGRLGRRGIDEENSVVKHVVGIAEDGGTPVDIGGCSKCSSCGLEKPVACYTCFQFVPWDDGPHEVILCSLHKRKARQYDLDPRVSEGLDSTILAVTFVVEECKKIRMLTEDCK